jgi:hypothetical protein
MVILAALIISMPLWLIACKLYDIEKHLKNK